MKKIILSYCCIIILFSCLALACPANAAESTVQLKFTPNVGLGPNMVKGTAYDVDTQTLGKYIQVWYGLIIGTVGILAAIMIMYGGFRWLTSRGGQAVSEAKDIIFSALIGLTLAFLSYAILYLINPNLLNIGLPGITGIQSSGNYAGDQSGGGSGGSGGGGSGGSGGGPVNTNFSDNFSKPFDDVKNFAASDPNTYKNFRTTSGVRTYNPSSDHYTGNAADVAWDGMTDASVDAFTDYAEGVGLWVLDERTNVTGNSDWTGPHIHLAKK